MHKNTKYDKKKNRFLIIGQENYKHKKIENNKTV